MSGVKDRAAVVASALLDIVVGVLREHPEFQRYARRDLHRVLERAQPEFLAVLRHEFHEVQQTTMSETR
jgi:hypothetical protein